jgi:hypothetical protein
MIRVPAVFLGVFLLTSSLADMAGLIPHSMETPPLRERMLSSMPLLLASLAFVIPYRMVKSVAARRVVMGLLVVSLGWVLFVSFAALQGYVSGRMSWHVMLAASSLWCVFAANLGAFFLITSSESPARRPGLNVGDS